MSRWKVPLLILAVGALLVSAKLFHLYDHLREVLAWIRGSGGWGPALFILLYVVASVFLIPASILTLGAGALFGLWGGFLAATAGAICGATAAFLAGRYLARDWVARKIAGNPRFAAIDEAVGAQGGKIVLLTRLSPVFPFVFLNYAFGLTRVTFRQYFLASCVGMLPGGFLFVYLGWLAGDLAGIRTGRHERTPIEWAFYAVGLVATAAVTVVITRIARKALAQAAPVDEKGGRR